MFLGYIPGREMIDLSLAYSTVYHLGLDKGGITTAVNIARTVGTRQYHTNNKYFILVFYLSILNEVSLLEVFSLTQNIRF